MPELCLYYPGSVVRGPHSHETWEAGPDDELQVVVLMEPPAVPCRTYPGPDGHPVLVTDRRLWEGEGELDPFGWGPKRGSLLSDGEFRAIWVRACTD